MAENQDGQERTEQPSPKRLQDAKDRGQVAKSQELNTVAVLITGMLAFKAGSALFASTLNRFMITTYHESSFMEITVQSLPGQAIDFMKVFATLIMPVMGFIVVAAVASNLAQVGFFIAKKALTPKFSKINPMSGLKRIFSARSLVELVKGLLKIAILGLISYWVINKYRDAFLFLPHRTVSEIVSFLMEVLFDLTLKVGVALLLMAIADYAYQRYEHIKSLKMTKEEVKEEFKQYEGSPVIKKRIKEEQIKLTRSRMFQQVPEATVVVTNPTHIAVALKYDPQTSADAPQVIAKGKLKIAERIKQIARDNDVPVIENKPLARGLYESCEIGMEIPVEFYQAVAEILSQIYQTRRAKMPKLGVANG